MAVNIPRLGWVPGFGAQEKSPWPLFYIQTSSSLVPPPLIMATVRLSFFPDLDPFRSLWSFPRPQLSCVVKSQTDSNLYNISDISSLHNLEEGARPWSPLNNIAIVYVIADMWIIHFIKLLPLSSEGTIIIAIGQMIYTGSRDSLKVTQRVSFGSRTGPTALTASPSTILPLSFLSISTTAGGIKHVFDHLFIKPLP